MTITSLLHDAPEDSVSRMKVAHESDMKQVKVHSSAMNVAFHGSARFTIYTMIVTCPGTKTWWILKKRYSQFFSVRKQLLSLFKASTKAFPALADILAGAIEMDFPKKHMMVSVDNKAIIKERKTQFQRFTAALIAIRASCVLASLDAGHSDAELQQLDVVYDLLHAFLEIPTTQDTLLGASASPDTDVDDDCCEEPTEGCDSCSICLNEFKGSDATYHYQTPKHVTKKVRFVLEDEEEAPPCAAEDKVLKLPCNHFFHEECVMYWIEQKNSCPLCRAAAFEGSIL